MNPLPQKLNGIDAISTKLGIISERTSFVYLACKQHFFAITSDDLYVILARVTFKLTISPINVMLKKFGVICKCINPSEVMSTYKTCGGIFEFYHSSSAVIASVV
jgi:hypothetical protein